MDTPRRRRLRGRLLDVAAVADELGASEKAIRARIARGDIPARRLGRGRVIVLREELDAWLASLPPVVKR